MKLRTLAPKAAVRHQGMELEVVKSYLEANRLILIKHNMFDEFDSKIWNMDGTGIVLDHKQMKVLARFCITSLYSRSSGKKVVTRVITAVNADGGKSLIDIVEILLDVMLMDILINALHTCTCRS